MKYLTSIAVGILLLVSAAAATGNNIDAIVAVSSEISGMAVTGASVGQVTNMEANLFGNDICADQFVDIEIEDSCLTGFDNGRTNDFQMVDLMLNSTGCGNYDSQYVEFAQGENCMTVGNITQMAFETIDDTGNGNIVGQSSSAFIGVWECDEEEFGSPNCLTNSELSQVQALDACVTGDINIVCQDDDQFATDNALTNSKLYEQVAENVNLYGCENAASQVAIQNADFNCLTDSVANKMISLDIQALGDCNVGEQFAIEENEGNSLTQSTELQNINMAIKQLGCANQVSQYATLELEDNCVTLGHIAQQTFINTND